MKPIKSIVLVIGIVVFMLHIHVKSCWDLLTQTIYFITRCISVTNINKEQF